MFTDDLIAFKANAIKSIPAASDFNPERDNVQFENVLFNHGDAFNHTSGRFITPVSGLYVFAINLCGGGNTSLISAVVEYTSQTRVCGMLFEYSSTMVCKTSFGIAELPANSVVGFEVAALDGVYNLHSYNELNVFMGALLKRLN